MSEEKQNHLPLPPDVAEEGGIEVLSAWVVNGEVSVALRRSFEDPFTWGVLLVDLARQAALSYAHETNITYENALVEIKQGILTALEDTSDTNSSSSIN